VGKTTLKDNRHNCLYHNRADVVCKPWTWNRFYESSFKMSLQ